MAELTLLLRRAKRNNQTKIDLSNKEISFIPNDLYGLTKIQILNLSNNRITSLDEKISQLSNLKVLDLTGNSIMDLPKHILELTNLQALILDGNPLVKEFQPLLHKSANLDIRKTIRICFGLQQSQQQKSNPSWLDADTDKSLLGNSKAFGKMVQMQNHYKVQQQKVKKLQKQLQKMSLKEKKSSKQAFSLSAESILQIDFKDIQLFEQISMGGFSTIHRGQYKGLNVAVKKVFNPNITQQLLQQFSNQINMLAKMRHPNIVLLIGISSIPPNLTILTEYIQTGSLYDLIHKKKIKLSNQDRRKIVNQILSSIRYLHQHNITHRDIKSHNFLVDQNLTVKLCDFGLARYKNDLNQGPMQFSGTPVYMAQQLFMKKSYDEKIDIFALGTLFYEIYTGQIPYNGLDPIDIKDKLFKDSKLPLKGQINKTMLELVNRCRNSESSQRPTARQLALFEGW